VASAGLAPVTGTLVISEQHPEPTANADFGSLHEVVPSEHLPLTAAAGARFAALLEAEWAPPKGWPLRYAARRIGWHILDHLWEIEDKS